MPEYVIPENFTCSPQQRQLFRAIHRNDGKKVKALLDKRCSNIHLEWQDHEQNTPLRLAARRGHLEIVRLLLDKGANYEYRQQFDHRTPLSRLSGLGLTPLADACRCGHLQVAELLLERGANPGAKRISYEPTPLWCAVNNRHIEIVRLLLGRGASIEDDCEFLTYSPLPYQQGKTMKMVTTPLSMAVGMGQIEMVRLMLQQPGANVDHVGRHPLSVLAMAIDTQNEDMVKLLLDNGANIDLPLGEVGKENWITALFQAIICFLQKGMGVKMNIFRLLLDRGANLEYHGSGGLTPLGCACQRYDRFVFMVLLLERGAKLEHRDENGVTPLGLVCTRACMLDVEHGEVGTTPQDRARLVDQYMNIIKFLLDRGANLENQDIKGITALGRACCEGGDVKLIGLLLDRGANLEHVDEGCLTPLCRACMQTDDLKIIRLLLDRGANLEHPDKLGITPLGNACFMGKLPMVRLLLNRGANLEHQDKDGLTPLARACAMGDKRPDVEVIRLLLDRGANLEHQCNLGRTSLSWACINRDIELIEFLVDRGANLECQDKNGDTPLGLASDAGHHQLIKPLLDRGANVEHQNNDGITPLGRACQPGLNYYGTVKYLLDGGAKVNHRDKQGRTPLVLACSNAFTWSEISDNYGQSNEEGQDMAYAILMVKLLLEWGAEVEHHDEDAMKLIHKALLMAVMSREEDMIKPLLYQGAMEVQDSRGYTILSQASSFREYNITRILLENGANIEHQDNKGETPLFLACTDLLTKRKEPRDDDEEEDNVEQEEDDDDEEDRPNNPNEFFWMSPLLGGMFGGGMFGQGIGGVQGPGPDDIQRMIEQIGLTNDDDDEEEEEEVVQEKKDVQENGVHPFQTVQLLLERGSNLEHQDSSGRTLLQVALSEEYAGGDYCADIVCLLVQAMAERSCDSLLKHLSQH